MEPERRAEGSCPATGTSKLDVIGYYAAASTAMLRHLVGRSATRKTLAGGRRQDLVGSSSRCNTSIFRELQMDRKSTRQRTPRAGAADRVVPDIGKVNVRHDVARVA